MLYLNYGVIRMERRRLIFNPVQESYLKMDITGKVELISLQQLEKELNTIQRDNPSQLLLMSDCDVQAFNTINAEKNILIHSPMAI